MTEIIAFFLNGAWQYIAGGIAIVGTWLAARRSGRNAEKLKNLKSRANAAGKAKEVRDEVNGMDDSRVSDELSKWMRDSGGS